MGCAVGHRPTAGCIHQEHLEYDSGMLDLFEDLGKSYGPSQKNTQKFTCVYTYVYIISASKCKGLVNELKPSPDFLGCLDLA